MTSPKELEGADNNLIDELMTMFADGYVDGLTYRAANEIVRLEEALASITRERDGYQKHLRACEQIAGKALGYPWFKDDQANFPGTTEAEGVCIGEHVGDTIVEELATRFEAVTRKRDAMREGLRPFAEIGHEAERSGFTKRDHEGAWGFNCINVTWGDFRRAAALVNGEVG